MGYNTTLLVLNDALSVIAKDPDFGHNVAVAIDHHNNGPERGAGVDIPSNHWANVARVISTRHADVAQIVAVGGNYGALLSAIQWGNRELHTPTAARILLRRALETNDSSLSNVVARLKEALKITGEPTVRAAIQEAIGCLELVDR